MEQTLRNEAHLWDVAKREALEAERALAQKDYSRAAFLYQKLLQVDPQFAGFWNNLGIALKNLSNREGALACTLRALDLAPNDPAGLVNLGNCYSDLDRMDEALAALSRAVQLEPDNFLFRSNYAAALQQFNKLEEALTQINLACNLSSHDVEARWQKTVIHLMQGNLAQGWKDFEVRWDRGNLKRPAFKAPQWAGEDLTGKTILLYEEQGFGDTILASRYIPLVKKKGAHVIFGCKAALHRLFRNLPGIDQLAENGSFNLDYHAPLISLPGIFGTTLDTIPPPAKLSSAETLPPAVNQLLGLGEGRFKVGIIWSGNPDFKNNFRRAVSFTRFLPLAEIPGVQLYSLQMGTPAKELIEAGAGGLVPDLAPHLKDFADTAAVLAQLDLVIMTDSSVAHLAGSLGHPIWNLLNYSPYWLYMTERSDSPWYPSMRLFRQPQPGDWDSVFEQVSRELAKAVAAKKAGTWPALGQNK